MSKKWYNFFVVADGAAVESAAPAEARRVGELAPEPVAVLGPDAEVAGTGTVADVYAAARIETPAHGYTVLKVADMLRSDHISALSPDVKRKSILLALDAAGVSVDEVVRDAVARDRALDTYERVLEQRLEDVRAAATKEIARLEAEVEQLVAERRHRIDESTLQVSQEQDALEAWRTRKHREEATIAEAVSHFVSENPITTTMREATGESDVR